MAVLIQSGTTTANAVTTVSFTNYYPKVDVLNRGSDDLWVTCDGSTPVIGANDTYVIPTLSWKDNIVNSNATGTTVKLISASAVAFTVEGLNF